MWGAERVQICWLWEEPQAETSISGKRRTVLEVGLCNPYLVRATNLGLNVPRANAETLVHLEPFGV